MFFLSRLLPNALKSSLNSLSKLTPSTNFHSLTTPVVKKFEEPSLAGFFSQSIRTIVRCHFPRPSERRRVKRHGWNKRMSTPEGRRIIMNRILKGRWVYTH